MKKNATAVTNVNSNKKAVLTMSTSSSCLYGIIVLESIGHNIHLHWAFLRKVKNVICKRFSGNKLVLSWYGHNVSHLIFASCYVRDTHCSRHFHVAIFFSYGEINVKRKFHVIRYIPPQRVWLLGLFGLKTAIHFAYCCLESGIVFEGTTGVHERSFRFNSKWRRK